MRMIGGFFGGHGPAIFRGYHWGGHGRGGGRFGRWGWHHRPGLFGGGMPDPQVQWAQSCLAQVVDPSVPQDGRMGFQTRQAIQNFQSQQQLPPTGMLDPNTTSALQAACNPQPPAPPPPPPPPPPAQVVVPSGSQQGGRRAQGQPEAFLGDLLSPLVPPGLGSLFNLGGGGGDGDGDGPGVGPGVPGRWHPRHHWHRGRRWSHEDENEAEFRGRPGGFFARPMFGFHPGERFHEERDRFRWDRRWFRPGDRWDIGFGIAPGGPRVAWAQSCLAQVLGSGVAQDGVFGPNTQAAIRTFQEQQSLPATGVLDENTVNALQAACGSAAP